MGRNVLFETTIEALRAVPAFGQRIAGDDRAFLLLDRTATQLLHASPAAAAFRDAIADRDGRIDPSLGLPAQLRGSLSLPVGTPQPRLERLRLAGRLAPPLLCACLPAALPDGEPVFAVAILDPLPARRPRRAPASTVPAAVPSPDPEPAPELVEPKPHPAPGPALRFLWRSDARGCLVEVTGRLPETIGASPVGRSWDDLLAGPVEAEPALGEALAQRNTFRAVPVRWRIAGTRDAVMVDLSGAPRLGAGRAFAGFSGFGVVHPERVVPAADRPDAAEPKPLRPTLRERAAAVIAVGRLPTGEPIAPPQAAPEAATRPDPAPAPAPDPDTPDLASLAGATMAEFAGLMAAPFAHLGMSWGFGTRPFPPSAGVPDATAQAARSEPSPLRDSSQEDAPPLPAAPLASPPEDPSPPAEPAAEERPRTASLSLNEHAAFREIARALGARFAGDPEGVEPVPSSPPAQPIAPARGAVTPFRGAQALARLPERGAEAALARLVERLPVGLLVHRGDEVLLANRHLLALSGYDSPEALAAAGGPGVIFRGRDPSASPGPGEGVPVALATRAGGSVPVGVSVGAIEWDGAPASLLTIRRLPDADPAQSLAAAEAHLAHRDAHLRETTAILDAVTDGVVVLDEEGRIVGMNRGAQALLGADPREVAGEPLIGLFSPESRPAAQAALLRASAGATATTGDEVMARGPDGPLPLLLTLAPVASGPPRRVAAVLRDVSASRRTEAELVRARREAERASAQKSDFLATISHEVRTPLNAIIGFAEVMLEEQFGPVGSDRYRDYLRDIRASGEHVVSLVNDLLDLAKIEAGHLDLAFAGVALNDLVAASVALMQPQAARQRVVMRTSFAPGLPAVLADQRSLRQAALNVISNAIKFTDAGGQVIVSTAVTDRGGVALRVRDTGIGMSPEEIETALQPFRQIATAQRRGGGTGLGLPLTKALVEANRAALTITSRKGEGTLVEVLFPAARVLES
ncbi:PAS domain-containing sensor histidine kinase [Methylobacterium frigidaeris]|uniref:histidine kinase n=1 Tax=Methylobacterium frigidaeris TaxID=2038277 RepID=A0AA37HCF7_9HYPH|nr:PAS domain-containing protein [Methylobacterium frigidaeris]PIK70211.1 PAS domain-containing sensor histidine kinase [Methylobacterium frigidaeris]GJD62685.1 Sensor histidine kinase RcsC [Methylobacterium frigidaeris]